jgi:hypothetical protein
MSVYWLNLDVDTAGVWENEPAVGLVRGGTIAQQVGGADIEILEVKVSGGAVLSVQGGPIAPVGGPDVSLFIQYASGDEFRSGPSDRPYALSGVEQFTLIVEFPVGIATYDQVNYSIAASAHVQWAGPSNVVIPPPFQP